MIAAAFFVAGAVPWPPGWLGSHAASRRSPCACARLSAPRPHAWACVSVLTQQEAREGAEGACEAAASAPTRTGEAAPSPGGKLGQSVSSPPQLLALGCKKRTPLLHTPEELPGGARLLFRRFGLAAAASDGTPSSSSQPPRLTPRHGLQRR